MMSPELVGEPMPVEHMYDSVNVIMSLQVTKLHESDLF